MRLCNANSDFQLQLFTHSSQLPDSWALLLPKVHFLQPAHLALYERAQLPDVSFVYVLISQKNQTLAIAHFQVLSITKKHLSTDKMHPLQQQAWRLFTTVAAPRLLVGGHLFRHDICSFYRAEGVAPFDAFRMYQAAIKKAARHACAHAVLVKDIDASIVPYIQHYAPKYLLLRNDISMEMALPKTWESMADYEKSLKHKYAQRFRKVRHSWQQLSVRELSAEEVVQHKSILYDLYRQVSARQQVRLGMLSEDFLPELKANNPDLHVWLATHEGNPVAFFSAWTNNGVFDMFYIGFDYAKNDALQLYFNILFFAVEQAILMRKEKLILGRTALEAKARLGCKPRYLSTYLYIRNPLLRQIINRLQTNINSMEGEWENRHPFKNPPPIAPERGGAV